MMEFIEKIVNFFADACAVITAIIAVLFYFRVRFGESSKVSTVEHYLKLERAEAKNDDRGQRSILNIMAKVGLSEDEVLKASFQSKFIRRLLKADQQWYASSIILWYEDKPKGWK